MNEKEALATPNEKPTFGNYGAKTYLKFIIPSLFGIFAFFINFSVPAYHIVIGGWEWGSVAARETMLITHLTNFIRAALWDGNFKAMPVVIWLLAAYCVVDMFLLRFDANWRGAKITRIFCTLKIIGFVLFTFTIMYFYFNVQPAFLSWYFAPIALIGGSNIAIFVMERILITITITIPLAAVFLPFLTGYGLVDFVGVVVRRFMRPVFRLPGRAAVIAVSALLASFVVGHMGANEEYKSGRMTKRESMLIATSLTSASIGFMLVLATNTNIMHIWNVYLWSVFFLVLLITFITSRVYPLSKIPDTYYEGASPAPEKEYNQHIMRHALKEALDTAENAQGLGKIFKAMMKDTLAVLGTCSTGSTVFAAIGIVLYVFTPVLQLVGYIFYPVIRMVVPISEVYTVTSGAALSFIEITLPSLLVAAGEWTLRARFILAVIPCTSVIFLATWIPCIMGTSLPVKFGQLVIIWVERMILSIIFASILAVILFPAGAV